MQKNEMKKNIKESRVQIVVLPASVFLIILLWSVSDYGEIFFEDSNSSLFEEPSYKRFFLVAYSFYFVSIFVLIFVSLLSFKSAKNQTLQEFFQSKGIVITSLISILVFLPTLFDGLRARLYVDTFYWLFGVGRLHPNYADLRGTLAAIESVDYVGQSFTIQCETIDEPCLGWGWSYGSTILKTPSFLIIDQKYAWVLAIIFFLSVMYVFLKVDDSSVYRCMLILILPSGTFLLAFERMNIDILTVPLVYMLARSRFKGTLYGLISLFFLTLFTLTKYYTLPLFLLYILIMKSPILRITAFFASLVSLKVVIQDIGAAGLDKYSFGYAATLGLKNLIGLLSGSNEPSVSHKPLFTVMVVIFLVILIYFFFFLFEKSKSIPMILPDFKFDLFLFSLGIIFPAWILGSNYPYRMVSLVLVFPFMISLIQQNKIILSLFLSTTLGSFFFLHITLAFSRNLFFALSVSLMISALFHILMRNKSIGRFNLSHSRI
jgi:hypothetical protein